MNRFVVHGLALTLALAACGQKSSQQAQEKPPPPGVLVAKAEQKDVHPTEQFTGRADAKDEVDIRARVQGFLDQRTFEEGQNVKAGELLFRLEQAPYTATVRQREADLARAEAEQNNARVQFDRAKQLLRTGNIPQSEADKREATFLTTQAAVKQAQAALDAAQINLGYTEIRAPIDGRIGRSQYTVGALVGPAAGVLTTIVNSDPIYVTFPVSQRELLDFRRKAAEQGRTRDVVVRLRMADGTAYKDQGKIDFLDVKADPGTDTVTVRALFPNPDNMIVPGQFASVSVVSAQPVLSVVVPQSALQIDQAGAFVMVVDGNGKVEMRRVQTGAAMEGGVVVDQGVQAGERVVVEGAQKVRPGQEVQVSEMPGPPGTEPATPPPGENPS
ncbi:MAG: efflux RND transporter periplasmic adaptor subunit [Solirubrobacterales bacterium]